MANSEATTPATDAEDTALAAITGYSNLFRLKPAYVLNETDVTDETSPQKVHFTPPEIPNPTSCPETPKISRSGRIIRRPRNKCLASVNECHTTRPTSVKRSAYVTMTPSVCTHA
ncbi:hypothetical protein EVAR_48706_1 [Eumeta japonica]|uniref:Uncharacterized protein n=1 Tax=Eumeta variegata TaxID=151549 RepID=A0A4C1XD69_EUMVA|nr:hypothetical protein EVAR_48706_1 [Eumeta japonica]